MGETNLVLITAQKNVVLIGKGHSCSGFNVHLDEDLTFTVTVFLVCVEGELLILKFFRYRLNLTVMNLYKQVGRSYIFSLTSCILDMAPSL